jgi:uncharacterized protein with HEPN domain
MRDPAERLRDILVAIDQIEEYSDRGQSAYEQDKLIQSWFIRHLQIIGEAARALPEDIRARAPSIPWRDVIGMRHVLVHQYFGVDLAVLWEIVANDLPRIKPEIEALLHSLEQSTPT